MVPSNNVKAKLLLLTALLGIILIISAPVVSSVFVNLINPTETVPLSSTSTMVFMYPSAVIDETLQPYNTTIVHVNVSDVTDLFTWQVNMTWDPSILNVSNIIPGEFLARSVNQTSSEALGGLVINATYNAEGYAGMAESILGNVSGVSSGGVNGTLVSIEFLAVGYGCTEITVEVSGTLSTMLLNSTGHSIDFTATGGYFRNKIIGDADGTPPVNILDILKVKLHWYPGPPTGPGGYDRNVDINDDGSINILDILLVKANWGRPP